MESLFENNRDSEDITCYIVEREISEDNKRRLLNIAGNHGRNLEFIKMPTQEDVFPGVNMNLGNAFARMAIGEILPASVDRVILMDCDTLILDSLKEMYDVSFNEDEYVAGVYDCVGEAYQRKVLKASDGMKYCNAGMFLVNLDRWRNLGVKGKLLDAFKIDTGAKLFFLEQDLMNMVFDGHLKLLHLRYNIITSLALFDYDEVMFMKHPVEFYSKETYYEARENPAIIHGATCYFVKKRMWVNGSDHPYAQEYIEYRNKTPWKDLPMIQDQRTVGKRIYAQFWHIMPRQCAIAIASFLMNHVRPWYAGISNRLKLNTVANRSVT